MMNAKKKQNPLKNPPLRLPGQSDEMKIRSLEMSIVLYVAMAGLFIVLAISEWWRWYRNLPPNPIFFLFLALIAVLFISYKVRRLVFEKRNWEQGREGEIEVGQCLEELRAKGYTIFHDIQCISSGKQFNIDHVVVSQHGIFAIETKTPSKPLLRNNQVNFDGKNRITFSGGRWDEETIPQAIRNARWLSDKILPKRKGQAYPVIPVVVYPAWSVNGLATKRVWVFNPKQLQWEIPKEPPSLTPEEVDSVSAVLNHQNR